MPSSSSSPDDRQRPSRPAEDAAGEGVVQRLRAELLDEVLRQTQAAMTDEEPLSDDEMAALRRVRQAHLRDPLTRETTAELVSGLLRLRFPALNHRSSLWNQMCGWIAETLLEDPTSSGRLQDLWVQLDESQS